MGLKAWMITKHWLRLGLSLVTTSTLPLHHLILEAVDELTDWIALEIHEIEITEEGSVMDPDVGVEGLVTVEKGVALVIAAEVGLETDAGDPIKKTSISIVPRPDCMYMYNFKHQKITLNVWSRN